MDLYNASMGTEEEDQIELTLEQYEEAKAHYQTIIERGNAARRLADNPDFKSLVLEGYLDNEPNRLANLMASGRLNDKVFADCTRQIRSVADFREFMKDIINQSSMAEDELKGLEEARDLAIKEAEAAE